MKKKKKEKRTITNGIQSYAVVQYNEFLSQYWVTVLQN